MDGERIARWRMHVQRLTGRPLDTPGDVVHRLGGVQAQDYGPAKWSVGQRARGVDDADMDTALARGEILRTHALRPTWHFVARDDIWWIQQSTATRVQARNAHRYRQLDLNHRDLRRANQLITGALEGGNQMTRKEVAAVLQGAGISTDGQRLAYMLMNAELECLICSGALKGKQHTYALLDERAPKTKESSYEEALAQLTFRYFSGHGPSTAKDFAGWASLRMSDVREGLDMVGPELGHEVFDGQTYWFGEGAPRARPRSPTVHLVQGYDEYIMGYSQTRWVLDLSGQARKVWEEALPYTGALLLDTQVRGAWKRFLKKEEVVIEVVLFTRFDDLQMAALEAEAARLGRFAGLAPKVESSLL